MAEPEHSGLRPLGPHGEGYCSYCRFIQPLLADGRLERHSGHKTSVYGVVDSTPCKGSYHKPARTTPWYSRLSRFRTEAEKVTCPYCKRDVILLNDGRMNGHYVTSHPSAPVCKGGYRPYVRPGRDHGAERG